MPPKKQHPDWGTQEQVRDIILGLGDAECLGHSTLDRPSWLLARNHGIGASEIATLLGLKKHMKYADTPQDMLALKTGKKKKKDLAKTSDRVLFGSLAEPALLRIFQDRTGRDAVDCGWLFRSADVPCLLATPDGLQWHPDRGLGLIELKCVWSSGAYDWGGGEWGPAYYACQVQQQLLVTGVSWGSLAGMVDGKFCCFDYDVDAKQHAEIIAVAEPFWAKVVSALKKAG